MICFIEILGTKNLNVKAVKTTLNVNSILRIAPYGDDSKAMIHTKEEIGSKFFYPIFTEHSYTDFLAILTAFNQVEVKSLA